MENSIEPINSNTVSSRIKNSKRLIGPLDEMVNVSVHKYKVIILCYKFDVSISFQSLETIDIALFVQLYKRPRDFSYAL